MLQRAGRPSQRIAEIMSAHETVGCRTIARRRACAVKRTWFVEHVRVAAQRGGEGPIASAAREE